MASRQELIIAAKKIAGIAGLLTFCESNSEEFNTVVNGMVDEKPDNDLFKSVKEDCYKQLDEVFALMKEHHNLE